MKRALVLLLPALLAVGCNRQAVNDQTESVNGQPSNQQTVQSQQVYCTGSTESDGIGGTEYPVDPKYQHLKTLGPIFTASNCDASRIREVVGGNGVDYDLGSVIYLSANPTQSFVTTLKSIGFVCSSSDPELSCKHWELSKTVRIQSILQLIPYTDLIKSDDCYNCG